MFRALTFLLLVLPVTTGCSHAIHKMAADAAAGIMMEAAPSLESHWDVDLFRDGLPGLILQMEGMLAVSPNNQDFKVEVARAYCSYAYGWVEDEYERAEMTGDFDKADVIRRRGIKLYLRARDLGLDVMRERDSYIDDVLNDASLDASAKMEDYLKREYHSSSDAELLFWTAMGWGSAINIGRDSPELIASLGTVKALAKRAMELDEEYYHASPLALMGALEAALPPAMGGKPEKGKKLFEKALRLTDRKASVLLVQYARTYALVVGDRPLYEKLMNEALEAEPRDDDLSLANEISRKRAARYLANIDADM